ncbi:MAG: TetR/AcrR family transcriptional regulator [Polyangiaceae bacterium]
MSSRRQASAAKLEPTRARLDVEERRRQLVALGHRLFSSRTYDEVSIDELARAAGISKGLLYHYFPTKRDFYIATVREAAQQLLDRTDTPRQMDLTDRLNAGVDAWLQYVSEHGPAFISLLRSGIGADAEVSRIVDDTREAFLMRLLEEAPIEEPSPILRIALRGWVGLVESSAIEWLGSPTGVDRQALRVFFVDTLLKIIQTATTPT